MSEFISGRLRDRGVIALIALLFSVGLWFRVVGGEKIEATKVIKLDYKTPKDLILYSPFPTEVTIRVRGPSPFVSEFLKQESILSVDLSKMGTGEHEVAIRTDELKIPLGIDWTMISPQSVKLFLDREIKKRVTVRPIISAQLPDAYKVETVVAQPSTVEVIGSRIRLGLLNSLPTEVIYLSENSLNQHFEASLNFKDFSGIKTVNEVSSVHVEVNLKGPSKRRLFRGIPIRLKLGQPARSYTLDPESRGIKLRPRTVDLLLEGPQSNLDSMQSSTVDVWVQLPELKKGANSWRLTWKLAPDVRIIDRSTDTVLVTVP